MIDHSTLEWPIFISDDLPIFPSPPHTHTHTHPHTPTRAVASLTVPGGQQFHFPHFPSNFDQFFLFFLKLNLFSSSFWLSGWATRPPGKALATPLTPTHSPTHPRIIGREIPVFYEKLSS